MVSQIRRGNSPVVVGVLQFELHVPWAESLKDKRRVVRSLKDRLHREHQVSVAEVGAQSSSGLAVLAIAAVGPDGARIGRVLDQITLKLRSLKDAELGHTTRDILQGAAIERWSEPEAIDREGVERDVAQMVRELEEDQP